MLKVEKSYFCHYPVGRTASTSPPVKSCFMQDFCSCRSSRLNPRSARKFKACCKQASNASSPSSAMLDSGSHYDLWSTHVNIPANHELRSLANGGFQNQGVCPQAFPSLPSPTPPPSYFCSRPIFRAGETLKTRFFALFSTETLAMQAKSSLLMILFNRSILNK